VAWNYEKEEPNFRERPPGGGKDEKRKRAYRGDHSKKRFDHAKNAQREMKGNKTDESSRSSIAEPGKRKRESSAKNNEEDGRYDRAGS